MKFFKELMLCAMIFAVCNCELNAAYHMEFSYAEAIDADDYYYDDDETYVPADSLTPNIMGTVRISGKYKGVPGFAVKAEKRNNVKKIVIGDGVQEIDSFAFDKLPNLKKVELPSSLECIGTRIFGAPNKDLRIYVRDFRGKLKVRQGILDILISDGYGSNIVK